MTETRDGSLWIATLGGAQRYRNGVFTTFTRKNGMASEEVRVVVEDRVEMGVVWVGTYNGLHKFVGGKLRRIFTAKDGLPSEKIRALLQSDDGTLWIGTTQGLAAFADGRFRRYDDTDGLSVKSIMTLLEDRKKRLWIGMDGGGLCVLEQGRFSQIGEREGLQGKIVFALAEDDAGQIWSGTKFGLHRYGVDGRIRRIGAEHGLQSEDILQIARGADGAMWIGTSVGVMRIAESELNAVADGKQTKAFSRLYNRFDGMATNNCNAPAFPCVTSDKRIWFPTLRGLTAVDPLHVQFNAEPPPITIDRLQIDSVVLPVSREVRIPAGAEKFAIRFVALSLIVPERVQFRYKLEGFDKDWSPAAAEREARSTNIPPGEYTFRVVACNNDGVWNESGVAMRIIVEPFFYQTSWFIALVALALGCVVSFGAHARTRRLREKSRELEELVARRTSELVVSNEEIQRQLTVLDEQAHKIAAVNADLEKRNAQLGM